MNYTYSIFKIYDFVSGEDLSIEENETEHWILLSTLKEALKTDLPLIKDKNSSAYHRIYQYVLHHRPELLI